ncbi:MAG: SRPBCC family protein [Acidimicrobiales bacterium]
MALSAPVIDYQGTFRFGVSPETVWDAMERTGEFETWWSWLGDFRLEGSGLEEGSVLVGVVSPPLRYHMRIRVELEQCVRPSSIEAAVHGDLEGHGRLELSADGDGTLALVTWTVEMMQRPMRIAARFAYPALRWGHDRVVDATVYGFRRQLAATADARRPAQPPE